MPVHTTEKKKEEHIRYGDSFSVCFFYVFSLVYLLSISKEEETVVPGHPITNDMLQTTTTTKKSQLKKESNKKRYEKYQKIENVIIGERRERNFM